MGASTNFALPWPEYGDDADVPLDMMELASAVDAALTHLRGEVGGKGDASRAWVESTFLKIQPGDVKLPDWNLQGWKLNMGLGSLSTYYVQAGYVETTTLKAGFDGKNIVGDIELEAKGNNFKIRDAEQVSGSAWKYLVLSSSDNLRVKNQGNSSRRYKKNVRVLGAGAGAGAGAGLLSVDVVEFEYDPNTDGGSGEGDGKRIGLIAEDVAEAWPEGGAVLVEDGEITGLRPLQLIAGLLLVVKDLESRVHTLESGSGR